MDGSMTLAVLALGLFRARVFDGASDTTSRVEAFAERLVQGTH